MTADTLERLRKLCERAMVLTIVKADPDWLITVGHLGVLSYRRSTLKAAIGAAYVDILGSEGAHG